MNKIRFLVMLLFIVCSTYAKDINLTGLYKNEPCNISIEITKNTNKAKYFYKIVDNNQTKSQGYISSIKSNGEGGFYIKFKKIDGMYENGSIVIQNYGNSMNEYNHFEDCDNKYLKFDK